MQWRDISDRVISKARRPGVTDTRSAARIPRWSRRWGHGNAVIAHDNPFNRWVVADGAVYFRTADEAAEAISSLLEDPQFRKRLSEANRLRHATEFTWERIGGQYQDLLSRYAHPADEPQSVNRS